MVLPKAQAAVSVQGARIMALFGDSITTDHISPAGSIKQTSPAGQWLEKHGVMKADFNSYGARRGNHDVMMRGTFANVRIKNLMIPAAADGTREEGGMTLYQPGGVRMPIFDAAMQVHGGRRTDRGVRRRGIRHRFEPRLGGQGHAAAGHPRGHRAQLRAHPPQQPGGHGRVAAAVQGQGLLGVAGPASATRRSRSGPTRR